MALFDFLFSKSSDNPLPQGSDASLSSPDLKLSPEVPPVQRQDINLVRAGLWNLIWGNGTGNEEGDYTPKEVAARQRTSKALIELDALHHEWRQKLVLVDIPVSSKQGEVRAPICFQLRSMVSLAHAKGLNFPIKDMSKFQIGCPEQSAALKKEEEIQAANRYLKKNR